MGIDKVIETPRAEMLRLVALVGSDDEAALASVQALVDLLTLAGVITQDDFYRATSERLVEALERKPHKVIKHTGNYGTRMRPEHRELVEAQGPFSAGEMARAQRAIRELSEGLVPWFTFGFCLGFLLGAAIVFVVMRFIA